MLEEFCEIMFNNKANQEPLACKECPTRVQIFYKNRFKVNYVIKHASLHLGKNLFKCRFCKYKTPLRPRMRIHNHSRHQANQNDYIDLSEDFRDDLEAMIKRCFDSRGGSKQNIEGISQNCGTKKCSEKRPK